MAGIFRFSNAVSDIDKLIDTYKKIFQNFKTKSDNGEFFDHDEAAEFLALEGLASSLGAIGHEALRRSRRDDKTRDPLYNQHKSYSEMFRMLGWYESGNMQSNFKLPEYGEYIAETDDKDVLRKLFSLNVLHIVSPNPLTTIKGYNRLRPFPMIMKLLPMLGNIIYRDEIIIGVLACADDRKKDVLQETARKIRAIRSGGITLLESNIDELMLEHNLNSKDTLRNYTRFPIAALKWTGWTCSKRYKIYGKSLPFLELTDLGKNVSESISDIPDIRMEDVSKYPRDEQVAFVILSNLQKLESVGFQLEEYADCIKSLKKKCSKIISDFNIDDKCYLFFGYQESPRDLLKEGDELLDCE